jgi:hypothetical protein
MAALLATSTRALPLWQVRFRIRTLGDIDNETLFERYNKIARAGRRRINPSFGCVRGGSAEELGRLHGFTAGKNFPAN